MEEIPPKEQGGQELVPIQAGNGDSEGLQAHAVAMKALRQIPPRKNIKPNPDYL